MVENYSPAKYRAKVVSPVDRTVRNRFLCIREDKWRRHSSEASQAYIKHQRDVGQRETVCSHNQGLKLEGSVKKESAVVVNIKHNALIQTPFLAVLD